MPITTELTKESATKQSFFKSLTFRSLLVGLLMLLMMIPLLMVDDIVRERNSYYHSVIDDISKGWGSDQTLIGPVLVVPYVDHITSVETITDSNGVTKTVSRDVFKDKTMVLLPEVLNINTTLNDEHKKRGIYDALVYKADLTITGSFDLGLLPKANKNTNIRWKKAWLSIGLSDTKAISSTTPLRWEGNSAKFEPGTRLTKILPNGFHASMKNIPMDKAHPTFKIQLSFKGNTRFRFAPVGETSIAQVESKWPHPSFQGDILPTSKIISNEGFSAEWQIPHLARNYPQSWLMMGEENYQLNSVTTGVDLFTPVSLYSKVSRAVKYGALFIGLTFLTFLVFEVSVNSANKTASKSKIHIIQYAIIGISLILFYLLLISLSEQIPFMMAYIYAASTIVGIITLYTFAVLKSFGKGIFILMLLGSLYTALYLILQMEDYAMLAGAGVMLFVVVILMIATRNIGHAD